VFTFRQAIEVGFARATLHRRLASGAWLRLLPGTYTFAGTVPTRTTQIWAGVLAAGKGCVVSHETAALLHGAERLPLEPITLNNAHGRHHRLPGMVVHQIDDVEPHHLTAVDGLTVTTAARTVVDLGATQPEAQVGRVADDLVRSGRTSYAAISGVLARVTRPGKPGLARVAAVLDARCGGHVPPQSELERAMFDGLRAGGLPDPVRQIPLPARGGIAGVADAGYTDALIVLEADGRRWHARMEAARRDRERDAAVVRAGWVPLRFVYEQIVHEPEAMCDVVRDVRATRLRQLRAAS